ncbi:MAG: PEP-utilizing enzyme [Acidobacteria bacterium]|nr:PEP-utilizing enzyme [Acidobacteriota bacterium]
MTKADTLECIRPLLKKAVVDEFISFNVKEWGDDVIERIRKKAWQDRLIVRSSAIKEDSGGDIQAGMYRSVLNVSPNDLDNIIAAVNSVITSYRDRGNLNPANQIIIQNQVLDVKLSGVVFTHDPKTGAPYYVIEYDDFTGKTYLVTGAGKRKYFCVSRLACSSLLDKRWLDIIEAVKEIEEIFKDKALDIEFAIDDTDIIHIFQVRPLIPGEQRECFEQDIKKALDEAYQSYLEQCKTRETIYSDMSDWNPAEMLGSRPSTLAVSLYRYLITKNTWSKARFDMGYHDVASKELMVVFAGKPYIDVEASLLSFTPGNLPESIRNRLVKYQLHKLRENLHLHDKIEFEIAFTCSDILTPGWTASLIEHGFSQSEVDTIDDSLRSLTKRLLENIPDCITHSKRLLEELAIEREQRLDKVNKDRSTGLNDILSSIKILLEKCRDYGVYSFAQLARLAFVGNYLLQQSVHANILSNEEHEKFYASIKTIASNIKEDRQALSKGQISEKAFMDKYGHLRPGTYDITAPRYDQMPELVLFNGKETVTEIKKEVFKPGKETLDKLEEALKKAKLELNADFFLDAVKDAAEWRETAKFEFTRTLSDIIEMIADLGKRMGFDREDMAHIDIETLISAEMKEKNIAEIQDLLKDEISENKIRSKTRNCLLLPQVVTSGKDFWFFSAFEPKPNFITDKVVEAPISVIDELSVNSLLELKGKIVLIEAADPGYDWIFLRGIAGLVTMYGGVASHMAIRCLELNIPAAIGCGDILFEELKNVNIICIDAKEEKIAMIN